MCIWFRKGVKNNFQDLAETEKSKTKLTDDLNRIFAKKDSRNFVLPFTALPIQDIVPKWNLLLDM